MGVLACGRSGCERIMCDLIINRHYICDSCWSELLAHKKIWPSSMPVTEVAERIDAFMTMNVRSSIEANQCEIDAEFERLSDNRHRY